MVDKDIREKIEDIASKHENLEVDSVDYSEGKVVLGLSFKGGEQIKELPPGVDVVAENSADSAAHTTGHITPKGSGMSHGAVPDRLFLDPLMRTDLDLLKPTLGNSTPQAIYGRSIEYWQNKDVYGTAINVLTNFAAKGFENDIDDPTIKNFYDNWGIDVQFDDLVEKIFFDFFRVGLVRTYKIEGKYEPKINFLNSVPGVKAKKVVARRGRNRFTDSHIPIAYTILNPTMVDIKGSLMFGQTATFLKKEAGKELKTLMELPRSKLTTFQKNIIKNLPLMISTKRA